MSILGAIADDFTGATDLATNLAKRGFGVVVIPGGVPDSSLRDALASEPDAIVIALKTRTAPKEQAVADSLRALDALRALGCERFYLKYCSTFDSTDEGNIGPVLDALVDALADERPDTAATDAAATPATTDDADRAATDPSGGCLNRVVVVPSFPDNGRTVEQGILRVHGVPLAESPMKDHPLTPMRRSRVADLLAPQTGRPVGEIHSDVVERGVPALVKALAEASARYVVVDASTDAHLATIAAVTAADTLISGGSGLALGLTPSSRRGAPAPLELAQGGRLIVSGSASSMTRAQVAHGIAHLPTRKVDVQALVDDPERALEDAAAWVLAHADATASDGTPTPPLVYAVDSLDDLRVRPTYPDGLAEADRRHPSELIEEHLSALVARTAREGVTRVLVAGGETSGAVVTALGLTELVIGPEIAPGVCWAAGRTSDGDLVNIALKSGNFGSEDMFTSAWKVLHP